MWHFKHYCKLIFSTLAVVLVFACNSLVARADPLTGAMLAAGAADGFFASGMAGMASDAVSSLTDISYTDLVPWSDIVLAGKAYLTIRDLLGSNNVEVSIPAEISTAGYDRISQLTYAYNLAPGSFHAYGNIYSLGGYAFTNRLNSSTFYGPIIGSITADHLSVNISSLASVVAVPPASGALYSYTYSVGSASNHGQDFVPVNNIVLSISTNYNPPRFRFGKANASGVWQSTIGPGLLSPSDAGVDAYNPVITRSQDSVITNPSGSTNTVVIPASYVSHISYVSGQVIDNEATVESILDKIAEAFADDAIASSSYSDPVSSDTIAETPYITLDDTFNEFKEFFGDIYDGITNFHESFGDWVDNIASGWTEVFGDIFSELHDFKEAFGDWVNDIASGWTEVFGDIYSTVSSIYSSISGTITNTLSAIATAVSSLVESIENADFQFVEGFWKNFITPFNNLFNTIKSHLSIWHYVVDWLSSISGVFTFYLGVMSGAGSGFLLPIYACFAGTVVLAVYKRFGK